MAINPVVFQESGVSFVFNQNWLVRSYDTHTYFQGLSGAGLKGVDFLGVHNRDHLVLMEVKNYLPDPAGRRNRQIAQRLAAPEAIGVSIASKMRDTLRAIDLIHRYFQTRFGYRLAYPFLPWMKQATPEWYFWTNARKLMDTRVSMICWMQLEADHAHLASLIQDVANREVEGRNLHIDILPFSQNPFEPDLQIRV
ncbi:MAG: hypothetical protein KBG02_02515 [Haliscomenobacter sp.]|nr:hypothetical protein [Haliscomenobacter sp.]MBK8655286.1 hypothetical protein [Haliscomenobacter sp.]MBP9075706.1 hypothetical protein [Haliscomenobacter sp.]MBP9873384.1 hypothetical protein [Haliscomenobacter sp.]